MAGRETSSRGRAYRPLTEEDRARLVKSTGGEPLLDFAVGAAEGGSLPYIDYHHVDLLLALQFPRTDEPAELTFYITGQVQELLFKLMFTEVNRATGLLSDDRLADAFRCLRRIERVERLMVACWEPASTITPKEFAAFRDELGTASGFQSYMYRQLEFALGNKSPEMAEAYRSVPWVHEQIEAALHAPSLYDAALGVLHRRKVGIPSECVARDWSRPYEPHPAVEAAWAKIYADPDRDPELYDLGEALSELAYQYARWRQTHLIVVERILGDKPGTGGTSGIEWLRKVAQHHFFPELWSVRTDV